jgi:hypothetical protein
MQRALRLVLCVHSTCPSLRHLGNDLRLALRLLLAAMPGQQLHTPSIPQCMHLLPPIPQLPAVSAELGRRSAAATRTGVQLPVLLLPHRLMTGHWYA